MTDGYYGREILRRRYIYEEEPIAVRSGAYGQYITVLEQLQPGAGKVHQEVVAEVKKCAARSKMIPNPVERMRAQIECVKNIPEVMRSKGFIQVSKRNKAKKKYVPQA